MRSKVGAAWSGLNALRHSSRQGGQGCSCLICTGEEGRLQQALVCAAGACAGLVAATACVGPLQQDEGLLQIMKDAMSHRVTGEVLAVSRSVLSSSVYAQAGPAKGWRLPAPGSRNTNCSLHHENALHCTAQHSRGSCCWQGLPTCSTFSGYICSTARAPFDRQPYNV